MKYQNLGLIAMRGISVEELRADKTAYEIILTDNLPYKKRQLIKAEIVIIDNRLKALGNPILPSDVFESTSL